MNDSPIPLKRRRRGRSLLLNRATLFIAGASAFAVAAAVAILPGTAQAATICSNQTGNNGGYYYQMWSNGQGSACITLNSGNSYSSTWSGIGDFVAGVGWNPGSNHTVSFSSSLNASGGTTLISLYGWSTNPLVEYYVMENYHGSPPTAGTYMGQVTSDGGTYNIYEHQQVNQPCITGNSCTFEQYLAIRTSPVSSGTITTQNFFNAWASHGMNLGTLNYQIMATESWGGGSGNSSVTVNTSSSPPPTSPPPSSPPPSSTGPIVSAVNSAKCIDDSDFSTANGNKIQIWDCSGGVNQQWTLASDGSLQVYGKCMDITGANYNNGTPIQLYSCWGGANQKWQYQNGELVNPASGKCLDLPNGNTTNGTQLQLYTCWGGTNQQWRLP